MEPYLRGVVVPILDGVSGQKSEIDSKLSELRETLHNLHSLQIKLKVVMQYCYYHFFWLWLFTNLPCYSISNFLLTNFNNQASKNELLQTRIKNSLAWAEREVYEDCDQAFIPNLAERLSFAALQTVSGAVLLCCFVFIIQSLAKFLLRLLRYLIFFG